MANQISSLSQAFLEAKDGRVSQTFEALSGAKQIKILAWEDVFIERIQSISHFSSKLYRNNIKILVLFRRATKRAQSIIKTKVFGCFMRIFLGNHTNNHVNYKIIVNF